MPKKPTRANIKAAAELTINHEGSVEAAIASYGKAKGFAEQGNDDQAVETFNRLIEYCQKR